MNDHNVTNILFITSSRIGDAVLSTGLLNHIMQKYPQAKITVACGPLAVSLFEGVPQLAEIIPLQKEKHHKHWFKLWKRVIGTRWDMVIDLRNSAVSRLIRARQRFIYGKHIDRSLHKVEQNAAIISLAPEFAPAPQLWFTAEQKARAQDLMCAAGDHTGQILGVGPTANWIGKTWPVERFIEIVKFLTADGGVFAGARVAVFAAPGEESAARDLLASVPEEKRIDLIAKTDPGTAAACLARCDFYIGNDSGLMHCAAAAGVPTFGVFGPSYPALYRPWGTHTAYARTPETFDELIDFEGYNPKTLTHTLMESLSVDAVQKSVSDFLSRLEKGRKI